MACELLDEVHRDPAHRPGIDVLREPRGVARHGYCGAEVGTPQDVAGDVTLRRQRGEERLESVAVGDAEVVTPGGGLVLE